VTGGPFPFGGVAVGGAAGAVVAAVAVADALIGFSSCSRPSRGLEALSAGNNTST